MTRSGAFKLSIIFFLTFILCLPEFFQNIGLSQIDFLCEPFDPCTPENKAHVCAPADLECAEGWYLCKTEMDLQLLTSESEEHIMVVLTMKAGNLSGWNISEFAFLNNTILYTGPQNDQRLFHCYLPPDNSNCPDLNISMQENTSLPTQDTSSLKTTTSANPTSSSFTTSTSYQATASTDKFKCQPSSSSFLFYYQEHNETARSTTLPVTQTRKDGRWCVITSVWLALVLTVVVVTLLSVGNMIVKSRKRQSCLVASVPVSACGRQLKERSKQKENLISKVPDVSITMCRTSDGDVFSENSSMGKRTEENHLKVADLMHKRRLSPIYEITETSLNEDQQNEDEEGKQCNASVTKEEFKKSHQLQHLAAQGHCEPPTYLHHRSTFSCSGHEEDVEL
ncbi:hypothetical protein QQF64_001356 [Cirrhinus molitorella]|uniref:Uncharacterized protein n=2 Tax=Cirrhinus molitorella TaxID=172907 RepID=A0AA88TTS4_9TELE|nr:hypothetical protein Q8A67_004553 [Cirrhinus molitorella]